MLDNVISAMEKAEKLIRQETIIHEVHIEVPMAEHFPVDVNCEYANDHSYGCGQTQITEYWTYKNSSNVSRYLCHKCSTKWHSDRNTKHIKNGFEVKVTRTHVVAMPEAKPEEPETEVEASDTESETESEAESPITAIYKSYNKHIDDGMPYYEHRKTGITQWYLPHEIYLKHKKVLMDFCESNGSAVPINTSSPLDVAKFLGYQSAKFSKCEDALSKQFHCLYTNFTEVLESEIRRCRSSTQEITRADFEPPR